MPQGQPVQPSPFYFHFNQQGRSMNPVFHAGATQKPNPIPSATPLSAPARPAQTSPALTSAPAKSTKPALLSLKLNLTNVAGEADGHNTAPSSPSSRSKTKVHRAITEAGGQKRAIDGKDGPGVTVTNPSKRQKQSTPPGSPRGSTTCVKQLVRQSRPVTDLKAMAGLSPRRTGPASLPSSPPSSPPLSPGAVTTGDLAETRHSSHGVTGSSSTRSRQAKTGESAPRWRSTSHSGVPEGAPLPSPSRPARGLSLSSSLSLDPLEKGGLPDGSKPAAIAMHDAVPSAPAVGDSADENQWDFTFSECDFSQDGELILARKILPAAGNRLASSAAASTKSVSLSSTLIAAEILPKAKVQREAAASYLASLREQPGRPSNSMATALADAFKLGQAALETDVTLVEMALEQNCSDDAARLLDGIGDRLAQLKSALVALAAPKRGESPSAAKVAAQQVLSASLEAMEAACTFGVGLLQDEQASRIGKPSSANQPAQQTDPVMTPSNQALLADLDALDALMDEKILPSTTRSVSTAPAKQ
jgi:hypothetical protein